MHSVFRGILILAVAVAGLIKCINPATLTRIGMPKQVTFICQAGKRIDAIFFPGVDTRVDLRLSDGRNLSVPHAVSGSGARYASADGSFVFWNKGNTAFITEGSPDHETYSGCAIR